MAKSNKFKFLAACHLYIHKQISSNTLRLIKGQRLMTVCWLSIRFRRMLLLVLEPLMVLRKSMVLIINSIQIWLMHRINMETTISKCKQFKKIRDNSQLKYWKATKTPSDQAHQKSVSLASTTKMHQRPSQEQQQQRPRQDRLTRTLK